MSSRIMVHVGKGPKKNNTFPPADPPPDPPSDTLDITWARLNGGTGSVLASCGVLLTPGQLMPSGVANVAVFVQGSEVQCYVEALEGRYSDGSVIALLIQHTVNTSTQTNGQIKFGVTPAQSRLSKVAISFSSANASTPGGFPAAIIQPTVAHRLAALSAAYGPTISRDAAVALGAPFTGYEADLVTWSDYHWGIFGAAGHNNEGGYYERGQFHMVAWARGVGGNTSGEYFKRGCAWAWGIRKWYYEPNSYGVPLWYISPTQLVFHYWLTGDTESRNAIFSWANTWFVPGGTWNSELGQILSWAGEARPMARILQCYIYAHLLGYTNRDWSATALDALNKILTTGTNRVYDLEAGSPTYGSFIWQPFQAEGRTEVTGTGSTLTSLNSANHNLRNGTPVIFKVIHSGLSNMQARPKRYYIVNRTNTTLQLANTPGGSAISLGTNGSGRLDVEFNPNFMLGMLLESLRLYWRLISQDSRIPTVFGNVLTFLITKQWRGPEGNNKAATNSEPSTTFNYVPWHIPEGVPPVSQGGVPGEGSDDGPAPDLNGFYPHLIGWYMRQTGATNWDAIAQTAFAALALADGSGGPYKLGYKQFNEVYHTSWMHYGYRS
jgi:hypothetical protein